MVFSCCAVGCTNRFEKAKGVGFYRFPAFPKAKWIQAIKRERWIPSKNSGVCGAHFITGTHVYMVRSI